MTQEKKLFIEFPPISTEAWEEVIQKDLKGADYSRKLIWKNIEGIDVKPYYREEDLGSLSHLNDKNGDFELFNQTLKSKNDWTITQRVCVNNFKNANADILQLVEKGVKGFVVEIPEDLGMNEVDFSDLMKGLPLETIELHFEAPRKAKTILELIVEKSVNVKGSIDYAPITRYLTKGSFCASKAEIFDLGKLMIELSRSNPDFKIVNIHGELFHNSGASIIQSLAFALSAAAEYMQLISERDINPKEIASNMRFVLAVGSNYFFEIAAFRAVRYLWAKVQNAFTGDENPAPMHIHAVTGLWNKTAYDPYMNMLRTTTESMSAVLGGVDSLCVEAFNKLYCPNDEFGNRIAVNQQHLLKEESYLNRVVDPAAGSYYIESLTAQIIEKVWALFIEIEDQGGFLAAVKNGFIQESIQETAQQRDMMIAQRKEILVGTNQYPNFSEVLSDKVRQALSSKEEEVDSSCEIETLHPYRGAQAFESLRMGVDNYASKNSRPKAFMITMGNLAMRRARAQFSSNFFACVGIEPVDNNGFNTIEEGIEAFKKSNAQIAVLCSEDDLYLEVAPKAKELLGEDALLVVAGAPATMNELKDQGVNNFIHVKVNVLEELTSYLKQMQIV